MDFEIISFYIFGFVVLVLVALKAKTFFQCGKCSSCPIQGVCNRKQNY